MAIQYFKNFPLVNYNDVSMRNIMLKASIDINLFLNNTKLYTYQIKDGEKPTIIADQYYGDINYAWLVLLSNRIIDPYFEWPLTNQELDAHIIKKYGSLETAQSTVYEYKNLFNEEDRITVDTYTYAYNSNNPLYVPVYTTDKEFELNEQKRNIQLIDRVYAKQIANSLETLLGK